MMAKQSIFKLSLGMFLSALVVAGIVQVNHEEEIKNHCQSFEAYTGHMRIKDYEFINDGEEVLVGQVNSSGVFEYIGGLSNV